MTALRIELGAQILGVTQRGSEKIITYEVHGERREVVADQVLLGAGRAPNVEGLGLETVGVEHSAKGVVVDDALRTTNPHIYAAGDVCSRYQFTHAADALARIVIQNALFFGRKKMSALHIPWCTYTNPEVAHVGLNARDAAAAGIDVATFTVEFKDVDRAILDGETEGFARAVVRKGTDKLVGLTIVTGHAGEMIGEAVLAMNHGIGLGSFASTIHPYPTQAEALRKLGDAYNRTRLTPTVKRLFERLLAWRRYSAPRYAVSRRRLLGRNAQLCGRGSVVRSPRVGPVCLRGRYRAGSEDSTGRLLRRLRALRPRQLLVDHFLELLERLGAGEHAAVDEECRCARHPHFGAVRDVLVDAILELLLGHALVELGAIEADLGRQRLQLLG